MFSDWIWLVFDVRVVTVDKGYKLRWKVEGDLAMATAEGIVVMLVIARTSCFIEIGIFWMAQILVRMKHHRGQQSFIPSRRCQGI